MLHRSPSRRQFLSTATITLSGLGTSAVFAHGRSRRRRCCNSPCSCLLVRQDVQTLNEWQLESLRRGVAAMKALPPDDPRSWSFQANIHGMIGPATNPLFKQCEHGTLYFLMWHRGYIYFFERILRWAADDPSLTLPYWNWTKDPALPLPYRLPASASNPLYDGTRSINNGASLPSQVVVDDLNTALHYIPFPPSGFPGFSPALEGSPHGAVHTYTGGNMGSVPTAANDPIFWLHHCNIDRLWDYWLNLDQGRINPSASVFLNKAYSWVDESGSTVTVSVKDIMSSQLLGYRYDDVPNPTPVSSFSVAAPVAEMAMPHTAQEQPRTVAASSEKAALTDQALESVPSKPLGLKPERVPLTTSGQHKAAFEAAGAQPPQRRGGRIGLEIEGISFQQIPDYTYAVYLNLPEGDISPEQQKAHYVGTINFFGREHVLGAGHGHGAMQGGKTFTQVLDATETVARLQRAGTWKSDALSVTLLPLTPGTPSGQVAAQQRYEETSRRAKISYKRLSLTVIP